MTAVDWTLLEPHRPLHVQQTARYVARPEGGAAKLVSLVRAGANPIAVVGPMGSGKSTELMTACLQLVTEAGYIGSMHSFDHGDLGNAPPRSHTVSNVLDSLVGSLLSFNNARKIELSSELKKKLINAGLLPSTEHMHVSAPRVPASDLLRETLREAQRISGNKSAVLLCDGLEKYPADKAHEILDALLPFRAEATLVVVVPTSLVYGPASYDIVSSFKLFHVRAVPVRDEGGISRRQGRDFLKTIVLRRLGFLPASLDDLMSSAAEASGGVPRAFLQLVLDAATYARLAQREWPTQDDLRDAMSDHTESLRRLLVKGDLDALRAADGTDGIEIDSERRLRLLTHGLLLEYKLGDRTVVHPAPLLASSIPAQRGAA
jgi:hypothetical protein